MAIQALRTGDPVEVNVADLDELGAGVGDISSGQEVLRVHMPGALPGERVAVRLVHLSAHARGGDREAWADLTSVLTPSTNRVAPDCPSYASCGGCALMAADYPVQLAWKRQRVTARFAQHPELADLAVNACVASPLTLGYRNQAKYVYGRAGDAGRLVLGAFAPRSHRLVDLAGCRVVEPVLDEVRRVLLEVLVAEQVEPFDEVRRTALLRYAVMRATAAGQVMVTLVAARPDWERAQAIADRLANQCPAVASVLLNVNATAGNRIFGDTERPLFGPPWLEDRVGDVTVRLASRSFFQANRQVASRIYRDLAAAAPAGLARAIDVYAGAAPIALSLVSLAGEVMAIEENPAATAAAAAFLAGQGGSASRLRLVTGDAATCLAKAEFAELVVLNPPRRGCAPEVLQAVARLRPRCLAYLSCAPGTLARDLAVLVAAGARVLRLVPYDMMPHTPHVETLAIVTFGPG